MLCLLDKFNDNGTLGLDCTWQEFGAVGTATQYWMRSRAGFIREELLWPCDLPDTAAKMLWWLLSK